MSFNLFASSTKDDIKVGYIDPTLGYIDGVTICEANEYAKNNPGTTFIFRDGNNDLRYLNINEVNRLTPEDLKASEGDCGGIQQYKECGPPRIQFFGGGGIGAAGNPIIGRDGALLAVDIVRGGHGYQYPPIVAAKDDCQFGNGAVLTAILGETADEIEVFEGEEDFEEYEICEDTDVGYGLRYGPNGEVLGPWEPQLYTRIGTDPIRREIEIFQRAIQKPFWTTRKSQPDRIITIEGEEGTLGGTKEYPNAYDATHPEWGEFMNQYAVSPIKPSDTIGSDEAGKTFSMEWELNFPISGEYIFRGVSDETAKVYIDDSLVGDLKTFKDNPSPLQKTIQEGNHLIKIDLSNVEPKSASQPTENFIDVPITVYGEGGKSLQSLSFSFTSEDGSHTFTVKGANKSKESREETIKVKPNTTYKVVASASTNKIVEQGLIQNGKKSKEGGVGTSNKIFADVTSSSNDNDDIQITTKSGIFTSSNKRKVGGRSTYDLTFKVDTSQTSSTIGKVISSQSWQENPIGVSMIIDAPAPLVPQEPLPPAVGECPPNPIWSTRFPGSTEQWYPVNFSGSKTVVQETIPSAPTPTIETQEVEFNVYGEGGKNVGGYSFTFTAVDGQHTFTLNGIQKSKQTRTEKIQIRKNVNYVITSRHTDNRKVEQGLIKEGTKRREGGVGESNKIFADGVKTSNDNDDIQVTTRTGKFISSNKGKIGGRSTFDLTYVLEGSPGGSKNVATTSSKVYETPGWSRFTNRYAISPVLPLTDPGSDRSGTPYLNSWNLNLPYAGFYGVKGTCDDTGRLLIDGREIAVLQGSDVSNPKLTKVYLTKGAHTITTEVSNKIVATKNVIDTKVFSTQDWRVTEQPSLIDVNFSVYGEGGAGVPSFSTVFTSEDGSHSFTIRGVSKSRESRTDTIKVKPNVNYKVQVSSTRGPVEQGTIKNGTKNKEGGIGTSNKIFGDRIGSSNDNDDTQITASSGIFTSSNKRKVPSSGRSTYDLTFKVDSVASISRSPSKDGVTYSGPDLFVYQNKFWGNFMNTSSLSPKVFNTIDQPDDRVVGKYTLTWTNVNFPYDGMYKFKFQADSVGVLKIGGKEIIRITDFQGEPVQYNFNITQGRYDIVIELDNLGDPAFLRSIGANPYIFSTNPMGASLFISKDVVFEDTNKTPWITNPIGVSAILIPPPCAKKIGGKGVIEKVIVDDPGNGYLPPQGPGYPVTLVLDQVIVEDSGINYRCGEDEIQITPNNGAELSYDCDPFGRIRSVKVLNPGVGFNVYPEISMPSETGVNATFRPVFRVLRDPLLPPEKLIQVTDLVGLKQTGYVEGRAYYGAVYYDQGVPYAGFYKTAGPQTQVYATLQESITAQVTTPPSAIQRSGTDIRSNDPRLNIPGTIEDTQT